MSRARNDWASLAASSIGFRSSAALRAASRSPASKPEATSALARLNWRQYIRSWYIGYFQLPGLPEWMLGRDQCALLKRSLRQSAGPGAFPDGDLEHYVGAWSQPGALTSMLGWYRAVWRSRRQVLDSQAQFSRIATPTVLLWGERDIALGVELAEASMPYLADGRLVRYPELSHWVLAEAPDEVTRQLLAHFSG